jgi:glyoxylase-like metal-dependent hydrolase (beta-lactamase superfamily II)
MLSRRSALVGSAAAAASFALPAAASAPFATGQGPGVYRTKLGAFQITSLDDGTWFLPIDGKFVRNASGAEIDRALRAAFLPPRILPITFTALLVNTGSKLVLIDTGTAGQVADTAGVMLANLATAGVTPDKIDTILISHFHPDHIDGIKTKDGDKVFANAEIWVPEPEWAYWMNDANMAVAPKPVVKYFLNARRIFGDIAKDVQRFKPGAELVPASRRFRPMATRPATPLSPSTPATSRCWR